MYVTPDDISAPEKHRCGLLPTHAIARDWDLSSARTEHCYLPIDSNYLTRQFPVIGSTDVHLPSRLCSVPPDNGTWYRFCTEGHCPLQTGNAFRCKFPAQVPKLKMSCLVMRYSYHFLSGGRVKCLHAIWYSQHNRPVLSLQGKRTRRRSQCCEQTALTLKMDGLFAIWTSSAIARASWLRCGW
ncbi:hypothetical protein CDAR_238741 [Caerostris darwini]|uniref:Uncharacterized protein n=1 Tax=Caerostris darwini TaxID=1538125 RepID=A0AAV4PS63_9ARAC|nr:hypothetical protein CDAR_238741 [Caerostris darwini]